MILDAALEFSDAQTQAASSAAVTQSTNVVDTRSDKIYNAWKAALSLNQFGEMVWNVNVNTTINATTVITAKLMTHSAATSIKSGTQLAEIVLPAAAAAGTRRAVKLTPNITTLRYLGVTYTVSGAKCTAGAIDSFLSKDTERYD